MGLLGLKSRCWQGCVPSCSSSGESLPGPAQLPEAAHLIGCWPQALPHSHSASVLAPLSLTLTLLPPPLSLFKELSHDSEPTRMIQDGLQNISKSLITLAKSLFPRKATYSQVPGIRRWTCLGGHGSVYSGRDC